MAGRAQRVGLDQTLAALADPTRRQTLDLLATGVRRPSDLARALRVSPAALSRHLRVLRRCELVTDYRDPDDSRVRVYHLRTERLAEVRQWLTQFWEDQLDAFVAHAERDTE